jgi:acyl CoA:acetate/3-ketoacid CoA transferase
MQGGIYQAGSAILNEIGVRVALGAARRDVIWLTARCVVVLTAVGMAMGVPAARVSARLARSFLFGIEPGDVSTVALGGGSARSLDFGCCLAPDAPGLDHGSYGGVAPPVTSQRPPSSPN